MGSRDEGEEKAGGRLPTTPLDNLLRRMSVTAGCRFIAAKRLEERDQGLTRLTAFTSAYVIILTVLPYFMHLKPSVADWLNLFTVGCAIVILIASLLQNASNNIVNAEQHHRSGLEINELWREMDIFKGEIDDRQLKEYSDKYSSILQKYSINHDDIDFRRYQIERPEMYPWMKGRGAWRIKILLVWVKYVPSATLIGISLLVLFILFRYALPLPAASSANASLENSL